MDHILIHFDAQEDRRDFVPYPVPGQAVKKISLAQNTLRTILFLCIAPGLTDLAGRVRNSAADFEKDAERFDDIAMMCPGYRDCENSEESLCLN